MSASRPPPLRLPGPEDFERLASLLPPDRLHTAEPFRERYARDESTRLFALPTAVVLPRSEEEVCEILRWASAGPFAVIPRGTGTGVAGGALAMGGGLVLSLESLDRILEIDEENLTVTCEPGVVTARLQDEVERLGLFYPPDPASADNCSIGGNVAVGAGGARAVKYGTTRDYVLGMRVALADGVCIELGGKNVKDATGFHLLDLMVGSEGTLGVVTRVTLRLVPRPAREATLLMPFPDIGSAAAAVAAVIRARIVPALAEFMDDVSIAAASACLGRDLPCSDRAGAYVFFGLDGESEEAMEADMARVDAIGRAHGAIEVLAALDAGQRMRLFESRRVLGEAMKKRSPEVGKADVVVPRGRVALLVEEVKRVSSDLGIPIACFGHAGDGNVHVNVLRCGLPAEAWEELLPRAMAAVHDAVRRLGGRPSGEHGVGLLKKPLLASFVGDRAVEIMRGVKAAFDPQGILNPGKVL
jgi:glycolate oxidase